MEPMSYIRRTIESLLLRQIGRGKRILLLGPRQTGKTTVLENLNCDWSVSLLIPSFRQKYERDPNAFFQEVEALVETKKNPLIAVDEIQKVPPLLDSIQWFIDKRKARFILTGSSARKLRRERDANLLPGRVVTYRMDPLNLLEYAGSTLEDRLSYGTLPAIILEKNRRDRENDLRSYVETYLEEEIRSEAVTRNLPAFARFLELAASESGKIVSMRALSQNIGIAHTTVSDYYQILEDTMIVERIEPYTKSKTRKKLTRSSRYLFFDTGVCRLAAREGTSPNRERLGEWFEQWVGLELLRLIRLSEVRFRLRFWRDPDGPEVDWLLEGEKKIIPIEVKWTERPNDGDIRHLKTFMNEYPDAKKGFVVCRTDSPRKLADRIYVLPWNRLPEILS
jgi:predicted AAA+ superfamily ATPase